MREMYYTPSIDEFKVGFEYEYFGYFGDEFGKWIPQKVDLNTNIYLIRCLMASGAIRAKHLD